MLLWFFWIKAIRL